MLISFLLLLLTLTEDISPKKRTNKINRRNKYALSAVEGGRGTSGARLASSAGVEDAVEAIRGATRTPLLLDNSRRFGTGEYVKIGAQRGPGNARWRCDRAKEVAKSLLSLR
jgi:hypothetical protein